MCEDCSDKHASFGIPPSKKKRWCAKCSKAHRGSMSLRDKMYHLPAVSPNNFRPVGLLLCRLPRRGRALTCVCVRVGTLQDDPKVMERQSELSGKVSAATVKLKTELKTKHKEQVRQPRRRRRRHPHAHTHDCKPPMRPRGQCNALTRLLLVPRVISSRRLRRSTRSRWPS